MIQTGLLALFREQMAPLLARRIYQNVLPDSLILPAMTFTRIARTQQPTFETSGMQKLRMQFDFYSGKSAHEAAEIAAAFESFFNGFTGALSDGTYLQNAELITDSDSFEDVPRQYRFVAEYYLYFNL